jgi:hypothetical protein
MWNKDVNGKTINWGDRFTRNALFVLLFLLYGFQFVIPYFLPQPKPPIDPTLLKGLEAMVTGVVWFLIGRNTQMAQEKPTLNE